MKRPEHLKEHRFVAFAQDPTVCDTCGQLADEHPRTPVSADYRAALWRAMMLHGGIFDIYGGNYREHETLELRAHFGLASAQEVAESNRRTSARHWIELRDEPCPIDWKDTRDPEEDTVGQFDGTNCDSLDIPAMVGTLCCTCGEYRWEAVALLRKTLGQLIWLVVKAGDDIDQNAADLRK